MYVQYYSDKVARVWGVRETSRFGELATKAPTVWSEG